MTYWSLDPETAHMQSLHAGLQKLQAHGLRVKSKKCKFFSPSITYLGHKTDANGLSIVKDKVQSVTDAPVPQDVELRSFLGTVNYYSTFIPDLSTKLAPLLKSNSRWNWSKKCEEAFDKIKKCLCSAPVLVHYDPQLPLVEATDTHTSRQQPYFHIFTLTSPKDRLPMLCPRYQQARRIIRTSTEKPLRLCLD